MLPAYGPLIFLEPQHAAMDALVAARVIVEHELLEFSGTDLAVSG